MKGLPVPFPRSAGIASGMLFLLASCRNWLRSKVLLSSGLSKLELLVLVNVGAFRTLLSLSCNIEEGFRLATRNNDFHLRFTAYKLS